MVGKPKNLVEVVTSLTGSSELGLGVYRHIVFAHVPPIPPDRSHKNPVGGEQAHDRVTSFFGKIHNFVSRQPCPLNTKNRENK